MVDQYDVSENIGNYPISTDIQDIVNSIDSRSMTLAVRAANLNRDSNSLGGTSSQALGCTINDD